MNQNNTSQY